MPFITSDAPLQFSGKTLIVPIVSTANISQLAADLIIASLSLQRLAVIDPTYFIPIAGGRDDGQSGICLPAELYGKEGLDVVLIQQRSPVLKSRKQEFITDFVDFMQKSGISAVVLLSGVNLLNRTDEQMLTPTYQMTLPNTDLSNTPLAQLSVLPIPQYSTPFSQNPRDVSSEPQLPFIPGGGLTRRILTSLPPTWSIPTTALLQFVLEGDNRQDALMFASAIAKVVGMDSHIKDWKQPISWNQGLFGTPHDQSLYG